jgi:hypothetical protein
MLRRPGFSLFVPFVAFMDATDEVRFAIFYWEHFIVRIDWILNWVFETNEEHVSEDETSCDFVISRVFNNDHRCGDDVEVVPADDCFFSPTIFGVDLVLFELYTRGEICSKKLLRY